MGPQSGTLPYPLDESQEEGLFVCMLWHLPVSAWSSSSGRGWGCATALFRIIRGPGWSSRCPYAGQHEQWHSPVCLGLAFPLAPEELSWFPNLLYAVCLCGLLWRSCSVGSQSSFRKNCSKYRCTFEVFLGGGDLMSTYATILDLSPAEVFQIFHRDFEFNKQDCPYCT